MRRKAPAKHGRSSHCRSKPTRGSPGCHLFWRLTGTLRSAVDELGALLSLAFLTLGPGTVAAVAQSYSRAWSPTYAIIVNCELVTVAVIGVIVLGEKLTPSSALGAG